MDSKILDTVEKDINDIYTDVRDNDKTLGELLLAIGMIIGLHSKAMVEYEKREQEIKDAIDTMIRINEDILKDNPVADISRSQNIGFEELKQKLFKE